MQDLRVFVLAADRGSLSTAAHMLDLSPAVASASLNRLASDLSAVLLVRSTRSLRLSPEGESLLPVVRCARMFPIARATSTNNRSLGKLCLQERISDPPHRSLLPENLHEYRFFFKLAIVIKLFFTDYFSVCNGMAITIRRRAGCVTVA